MPAPLSNPTSLPRSAFTFCLECSGLALYSAIDVFYPGAIVQNNAAMTDRQSELLYFSLVTLSTIGYGDVVPVHGEVRMLAALEGVTGVLYVAITVAILVSAYKQQGNSR